MYPPILIISIGWIKHIQRPDTFMPIKISNKFQLIGKIIILELINILFTHTTQSNYYASIIYLNFINKETSLILNLFLKVDRKRAKKYTVCELKFFIHRLFTSISHASVILNMI